MLASDVKVSADPTVASAQLESGGATIGIELLGSSGSASEAQGSSRLYDNVAADTDALVSTHGDGVQLLSIMQSTSAPNSQRYRLSLPPGASVTRAGEGFVLVGANDAVIGSIDEPWARDATGRTLPTTYELVGTTLLQRTDTTNAVFPVVADPKITVGLGVYLNIWGHEARAVALAFYAVGGASAAISCTLISKLPHPALRSLATLVCGAAAVNLRKVIEGIVSLWSYNAIDGYCYQSKIFGPGANAGKYKRVAVGNCL
jgi:hypothetical protein